MISKEIHRMIRGGRGTKQSAEEGGYTGKGTTLVHASVHMLSVWYCMYV